MRYAIEYGEECNQLIIHVGVRLAPLSALCMLGCDEVAPRWLADISRTDGVVKASAFDYRLFLTKGAVFDWDEILPLVLYHLHAAFGGDTPLEERPLKCAAQVKKQREKGDSA